MALALLAGTLLPPSSAHPARNQRPTETRLRSAQLEAGGTRWMESTNLELVHFVCEPGAPYVVSLDRASMLDAGIAPDALPAFQEALGLAVADWRAVLRCDRIRADVDNPDANTRVHFAPIDTPGTLAVGTRAEHIVLNAGRAWFPGSQKQSKYAEGDRAVSFYWVVAHELGHVWGLAHSDNPESLMYPTQCDSCRWSSFEQAAGNLIHAAGLVPDWSRPYYANRFFVKTPLAVIPRLLTGDLPDEPLWSAVAEQCQGERCTSTMEPDPALPEGVEPIPRSSLVGLQPLRGLRPVDLRHLGVSRLSQTPLGAPSVPGPEPAPPTQGAPQSACLVSLAPRLTPPWEEWRVVASSPPLLSDF